SYKMTSSPASHCTPAATRFVPSPVLRSSATCSTGECSNVAALDLTPSSPALVLPRTSVESSFATRDRVSTYLRGCGPKVAWSKYTQSAVMGNSPRKLSTSRTSCTADSACTGQHLAEKGARTLLAWISQQLRG